MARTKASATKPQPGIAEFAALAKSIVAEKEKEKEKGNKAGTASKNTMPKEVEKPKEDKVESADVQPAKRRRLSGKTAPAVSVPPASEPAVPAPAAKASDPPAFDPASLPFELKWENYEKLKALHKFTDFEATSILVAYLGRTPEGKQYWSKLKMAKHIKPATEPEDAKEDDEDEDDHESGHDSKRARVDFKNDDPAEASEDGEEDAEEEEEEEEEEDLLSHPSGAPHPEVVPVAVAKPKIPPVPETFVQPKMKIDHAALDAKYALKQSLQAQATPSKAVSAGADVICFKLRNIFFQNPSLSKRKQ